MKKHRTDMELREINGFPNYLFNADTGEIISKLRRNTHLKIRHQFQKTTPFVQMVHDGKRRWISYNRLMYCIQNDICYEDIPEGLFITKDENGEFKVIDKQGQMDICNNRVKAARKRERIKRIDEKIHELEIMRRAYMEGSHIEAVQYIESRKELLICHHTKKYGSSRKNVEIWYNIALEWMIDKINSDTSQVTELTISMMGLMNKVRAKLQSERPLGLKIETASNSLPTSA
jgi:hypothetical protein